MSSRRAAKDLRNMTGRFDSNELPSRRMPRPIVEGQQRMPNGEMADCWRNGLYSGFIRRFSAGFPIGDGPYLVISIVNEDESARHDWREFQQLKNWLAGDEWEALELYPAESRLQDPSNCFYLWCVPKGVIPWGGQEKHRTVLHPRDAIAKQRPFPPLAVQDEP